jgi:hypothetical protein
MKTRVNPSKNAKSLLVTFYEGFSTYTITVPMPYAIRFFADGLVNALLTLEENDEVKSQLESKEGEKAEIQELLRRAAGLYEKYLKVHGR